MYFSDLKPEDVDKLTDEQIYDILMDGVYDLADPKYNNQDMNADFLIVLGAAPIPLKARIIKALELFKQGKGKNILFSGGIGWHKLYTFDEKKQFSSPQKRMEERYTKVKKHKVIKHTIGKMIPNAIKPASNMYLYGKARYRYMGRKLRQAMASTESEIAGKILETCKGIIVIDESNLFFENESKNTKENAIKSIKLIEKLIESGKIDSLKSIIVITSCYHCKRSELTFKRFLEKHPGVDVKVCTSTIDLRDEGIELSKESIIKKEKLRKLYRRELASIIQYLEIGDLADDKIKDGVIEEKDNADIRSM